MSVSHKCTVFRNSEWGPCQRQPRGPSGERTCNISVGTMASPRKSCSTAVWSDASSPGPLLKPKVQRPPLEVVAKIAWINSWLVVLAPVASSCGRPEDCGQSFSIIMDSAVNSGLFQTNSPSIEVWLSWVYIRKCYRAYSGNYTNLNLMHCTTVSNKARRGMRSQLAGTHIFRDVHKGSETLHFCPATHKVPSCMVFFMFFFCKK